MKRAVFVSVLAVACAVGTISAAPVARLYVTRIGNSSSHGIDTYLVDSGGSCTFERRFIAANSTHMTRPAACVKVGNMFYVLDQFKDPSVKFSIVKYDSFGNYAGTLVNEYTSSFNTDEQNKRDNVQLMSASRDGNYFYIPTWQVHNDVTGNYGGGLLLRISVASGQVEEFRSSDIREGASVCEGPDGTIYVASRNVGNVYAYRASDLVTANSTITSLRSFSQWYCTGVFYDDVTDRIFIGTHWNTGGQVSIYNPDGTLASSFTDSRFYRPGNFVRVGSKLYFGTWNGALLSLDPSDNSVTSLASGLGNVNHVFAEMLPVASPAEHTSFVVKDGTYYFAADNAKSAVGGEAVSTVWKSSNSGVTWTQLAQYEAANPSLFVRGNDLSVLMEPRRAAGDKQSFSVGDIAADGSFTRSFAVTNNLGVLLTPANGSVMNARWGFAGGRIGIGFSTPESRTSAALTFVTAKNSSAYPDAVITQTIHTNALGANAVRNAFADALPARIAQGPENGNSDYYQELVPVVQKHSFIANRVGPEYVLKTAHLNPARTTEFSPKWAPYPTEYIMMPGGSKEFAYLYDAASALYWAVTVPVTNAALLAEYEQTDVRNVLALYASPDLRKWQLCHIIRAEDTPAETAFARPDMAVERDDLLVTYSTTGANNAGQTCIGGQGFVFTRVANFRNMWPGEIDSDERYVIPEFATGFQSLKMFQRDPATGAWMGETIVTNGIYGNLRFEYPSAVAIHRDRIFVTCETRGVFEFDSKGEFKRNFPLPSDTKCDALAVSKDGSYLLVTDSGWVNNSNNQNAIRKINLANGTWTTLTSKATDSTFFCPRGVCIKSDGTFFVASRDNKFVRHYSANGSTYTTVMTGRETQMLALDEDESHLFVGTRYGEVLKVDLSNNSAVVLTEALTEKESGAYSCSLKDGLLWIADMGAGLVFTLDPNRTYQIPKPVISGFNFAGRGAFMDLSCTRGTILIIR